MAEIVNPQITDAVTQTNVKVLSEAPAMALGALYQSLAHSTGILFENAVSAQQNGTTVAQAAATQGVAQIYDIQALDDSILEEAVAPTGGQHPAKPAPGGD